jgi:hypothetical protein
MRRPPAVARTIGIIVLIAVLATFSTALLARAALTAGFPATRIKLDPASQQLGIATAASLTATVVDWRSTPLANVKVQLSVLTGPDQGRSVSGTTNKTGQTALTLNNRGGPGTDVVQATFNDSLEVHKSNRPFVIWVTGPVAAAIPSPAVVTLTPNCFQPLSAAAAVSDQLTGIQPSPSPAPSPPPYAITVEGSNFNPFTAVLITFDAAPGGRPQSFDAKTDGFGHFSAAISPSARLEGPHLVRVDDFREREATASFTVPCFQPSLALNPAIGPPGFVPLAYGTGFPPRSPIVLLGWAPGITPRLLCQPHDPSDPAKPMTDATGSFQCQVLVLYHDLLGPRLLRAIVANPNGPNAGAGIEADAPFLVTPGRQQPPDFLLRR